MNPPSNSIRSFFIDGPAGRLEAVLNLGKTEATHAALVCHPHPLFGGTLHNKVVFHTMKALNNLGFPALRFNFRAAGLSHGDHANGEGEMQDVRTALDWLEHEFQRPVIVAGFSFGAAMALPVGCQDPRVSALIGIGLPVAPVDGRSYDYGFLRHCAMPKLFVSGSQDVFGPHTLLQQTVAAAADPKELVWIEGTDHFFAGKLHDLRDTIQHWMAKTLGDR